MEGEIRERKTSWVSLCRTRIHYVTCYTKSPSPLPRCPHSLRTSHCPNLLCRSRMSTLHLLGAFYTVSGQPMHPRRVIALLPWLQYYASLRTGSFLAAFVCPKLDISSFLGECTFLDKLSTLFHQILNSNISITKNLHYGLSATLAYARPHLTSTGALPSKCPVHHKQQSTKERNTTTHP